MSGTTTSAQPRDNIDCEVGVWLRRSTLIDLTDLNANHIIPSWCHLAVSYRSLLDRLAPLGAISHRLHYRWRYLNWLLQSEKLDAHFLKFLSLFLQKSNATCNSLYSLTVFLVYTAKFYSLVSLYLLFYLFFFATNVENVFTTFFLRNISQFGSHKLARTFVNWRLNLT